MRILTVALMIFSASVAVCGDMQRASLFEVAHSAVLQSKLTQLGGVPFHLKARIVETTNPESTYKAGIEEYWVAPEKWRRTIHSPEFSQTLVTNGTAVFEKNDGDYYPWWLEDLVTAIFDPLPMVDQLKRVNAQIEQPTASEHSSTCSRLQSKEGYLVFCFKGRQGVLDYVVTPGYDATFKDYEEFKGKQIPRRIVIDPEPGTTIEAKITELTELLDADAQLFAVPEPTPPDQHLGSVRVDEETARKLVINTPEITWPAVGKNPTSGKMALFISVDRAGHVREVWPGGSDNSDLEDPAREQVRKWQFKPAGVKGVPVQMETILTFAFQTKLDIPHKKP